MLSSPPSHLSPILITKHYGLSCYSGLRPTPVAWESLNVGSNVFAFSIYPSGQEMSEHSTALIWDHRVKKKNRTSFFYLGRKESAEEEAPMRICFPHNSGIPCLLAFASCLCTPQKKAARGCWKLSVPPPLPLTKCGTAQWCMCLIHHRAKHYRMTPDTEKHGNPHMLQYMSRDALQ